MTTPEAQNFPKRASGAAAAWTHTGGRAITVLGPHRVTGKYTLRVSFGLRASAEF